MTTKSPISISHLSSTLLLVCLGAIIGLIFDYSLAGALIALTIAHLNQLRKTHRLALWFQDKKPENIPSASGEWGEIYDRLYRIQKRNLKQKKNLADAIKRFQKVINALPFATVVINERDEIEDMNGAASHLLGLRNPHDRDQIVTNLLRQPIFVKFFQKGKEDDHLVFQPLEDSELVLDLRLIRYSKNKKLLIAQDITYTSKLETMRTNFVANVSHELKTPITVFSGYLEHLQDNHGDNKTLSEIVTKMNTQSQRMSSIVHDLLALSKLEQTPVDHEQLPQIELNPVLQVTAKLSESLAESHAINIRMDLNKISTVKGNENELQSAFGNLIQNAIRYSPQNTEIIVRSYETDSHVIVEIEDQGIGIEPSMIPRITERFFRVDAARSRETGGTGLGLAITKHALLRHQAELEIISTLGKGSIFRCLFAKINFPL